MKIKIITIIFSDVYLTKFDLPKLRGYFSQKFPKNTEFHNHLPDGKYSYKFPQVQYRIIDKHPALIGFNQGIDILKKIFFELNEMIIDNRKYTINEKEICLKEYDFGVSDEFINYKFISPWMALKEENYGKYNGLNKFEQQGFLKHLLRENFKSLSKGFNYWIDNIENVKVEGYFKPKRINFKNQKMLCFSGEFMTNFHIPDFMGLGKQSARGFGVVKKVCL